MLSYLLAWDFQKSTTKKRKLHVRGSLCWDAVLVGVQFLTIRNQLASYSASGGGCEMGKAAWDGAGVRGRTQNTGGRRGILPKQRAIWMRMNRSPQLEAQGPQSAVANGLGLSLYSFVQYKIKMSLSKLKFEASYPTQIQIQMADTNTDVACM